MTEKYTPGPWQEWNQHGDRILKNWRVGSRGKSPGLVTPVAVIAEQDSAAEEHANATLIAAAPELLAALKILVDHASETYPHFECERGQRDIAQARAAITKAIGG
jgi:uncharacterized SAM-binding protein YcdF (DUF218 family)